MHHRHEQPGPSREHPPYLVARNTGDNGVCLRDRGGGSRFRIDDANLTEVVTDAKDRENAALAGSDKGGYFHDSLLDYVEGIAGFAFPKNYPSFGERKLPGVTF